MSGVVYVVATPIGNLGDITYRAVEVLKACTRIAAEDTRQTRKLLSHLGIESKPIEALHAHSTPRDIEKWVARLLEGEHVAVVTDAGTPLVSDPGNALVDAAIAAGVTVVPIPGPSAVLAALSMSGLSDGAGFRFFGFLPRDGTARSERIAAICETPEPVVVFESPERTRATLAELARATPTRGACVTRELTKIHEEARRGTVSDLAAVESWRGEIAIVLGRFAPASREDEVDDAAIDLRIDRELAAGVHAKTIAQGVAAWSGRPRRVVYERVLARKRAG